MPTINIINIQLQGAKEGGKSERERKYTYSERKAMNPTMKRRRIPMYQSSIMMNMAHPYSCHLTWLGGQRKECQECGGRTRECKSREAVRRKCVIESEGKHDKEGASEGWRSLREGTWAIK